MRGAKEQRLCNGSAPPEDHVYGSCGMSATTLDQFGNPVCRDHADYYDAVEPGTVWAKPGTGSTVRELDLAFQKKAGRINRDSLTYGERKSSYRTNLKLTGRTLTDVDLERIEHAK